MSRGKWSLPIIPGLVLASIVLPVLAQTYPSDQKPVTSSDVRVERRYLVQLGGDPEAEGILKDRLGTGVKPFAKLGRLGIVLITTTLTKDEIERQLAGTGIRVEPAPRMPVKRFDGASCGIPQAVVAAATPPNICRVAGTPAAQDTGLKAYVADTGTDVTVARTVLGIREGVTCLGGPCRATTDLDAFGDDIGHGTMIAGVIAAQPSGNRGLNGVLPGAVVIPVKIFGEDATNDFWVEPLQSLEYILTNAQEGDVVNLSWGFELGEALNQRNFAALKLLDQIVTEMADRGLRVVIAAGNADPLSGKVPWAGFLAPGNSRPTKDAESRVKPLGGIYVVSAVRSERQIGDTWKDFFWLDAQGQPLSYFGFKPSEYAAPGVGIQSLWLSNNGTLQTNVCSGTSFAAPHLAGLLLYRKDGKPIMAGDLTKTRSIDDPDGPADRADLIPSLPGLKPCPP
jgi:subtilisin family serine protease